MDLEENATKEEAVFRGRVSPNIAAASTPKKFFEIICPLLALAGIIHQMQDANDMDLVREFARHNSEAAFTELVRRHINLVYSVARRCTGNDGDAHDVTQAVFIILARKAAGLREKTLLTGWLYETTRFAGARLLRTNARRHAREQEAYMQSTLTEAGTDAVWMQLSPHLEAAMSKLAAADRALLVLRFYENKSGPEAAALLGIREDAAHKRVTRAIEKLRKVFAQRGVTLSGAAIAGAVSANSVQAAPVGLAAIVKAASLAAATTGTFSIFSFMTMPKLKLALNAMVVGGVTIAFVIQHQAQVKLRADNESLRQQITQLQTDNESLSNQLASAGNSKSLSDEQFTELLRLRGEVTRLRQQQKVLPVVTQLKTNNSSSAQLIQFHLKARFVSFPTGSLQALGVNWMSGTPKTGLLTEQQFKIIKEALQGASDVETLAEPELTTLNGRQSQMRATQLVSIAGQPVEVGPTIDVVPYFSTNSSTLNLSLVASLVELTGDPSKPGAQLIHATNQVTLSPGQTVVLENEIPSGGWLPDSTNIPAGPRSLLVFVTPTPVDEAGNRLNFPPPNQ
jgi:RNA polymerase sigma factor (sigma-70 family)